MTRAAGVMALLLWLQPQAAPGQDAAAIERIAEVRVHGNHTTPDAEVLRLAEIALGQACTPALLEAAGRRLEQSGRFRSVELRKRYQSIEDPSAILLVILIEELPGVSEDVPRPGILRRMRAGTMWLPVLAYEDGYGFTYGARFGIVDVFGRHTRLSVPLTWGGERRASAELERRFARGPLTRLAGDAGITQRENPAFDVADRRTTVGSRAERAISSWVRVGGSARLSDVRFGEEDERLGTAGLDAAIDTRRDPAFPRNAAYVALSVDRLWFERAPDTWRVVTDAQGYAGLFRQVVLVLRAQHAWAADPLPAFEQPRLGGAGSLRGFRVGYRAGDCLAAGSAELRVPITSPLRIARMGLAVFSDAGTVYPAGTALSDATWDTSAGAGVFLTATVFSFRLDVAHGRDAGTRAHVTLGATF